MRLLMPEQYKIPMTLQAAFVAKNGFVIASDDKANACEDMFQDYITPTMRRANRVHKILVAEDKSLVCAFSGDDVSAYAAQKLIESSHEEFTTDAKVKKHLEKAIGFARNFAPDFRSRHAVIAAIPNAKPSVNRLWRIFWVDDVVVMPITDKLYGGDTNNPAIFFGERYYSNSLSVKSLTAMAAHIVLEGHRNNGLRVDGLEVFTSEDGGDSRFLRDDELEHLRQQSDDLHKSLISLLRRD